MYLPLTNWLAVFVFGMQARVGVPFLKTATLGEEGILLKWHKLQLAEIRQSIYQRKNGLATVVIHTAGGVFIVPYIPVKAARQLVNLALFKTETAQQRWL